MVKMLWHYGDLFGTEPYKLHRRVSPDTSVEAANSVDTSKLERMVYEAIKSFGPNGCISDQVRERFPGLPYSSVTARFSALQEKCLIACGPDKRKGRSKRNQRVMRAQCFGSGSRE